MASLAPGTTAPARLTGSGLAIVAFFCVVGCTVVGHPILEWLMGLTEAEWGRANGAFSLAVFDGFTAALALIHFWTWPRSRRRMRLVVTTVRAAWLNASLCLVAAMLVSRFSSEAMSDSPIDDVVLAFAPLGLLWTVGAVVWAPIGLVYAAGLAPLFLGELDIAANPARDSSRRAAWLSARWGLAVSVCAALLSAGGPRPALLALASGIAALAVAIRDVVDVRFLASVERGDVPRFSLRDVKADEPLDGLLPYQGGADVPAPYRVLVLHEAGGDGPFRSGTLERRLYAVGWYGAMVWRAKWAAVVALASIAWGMLLAFG